MMLLPQTIAIVSVNYVGDIFSGRTELPAKTQSYGHYVWTCSFSGSAQAEKTVNDRTTYFRVIPMSPKTLLEKLVGRWEGNCRTWFEPGKLVDESAVAGEIAEVLDGRFLRHIYEGTIQGKRRRGEETIAFNFITTTFQSSCVDDFHMNYAIMFSQGKATEHGFSVRGNYDVGENLPKWGWRTEFEMLDSDHLTITAYNISPEGTEAKAIETTYHRIGQGSGVI